MRPLSMREAPSTGGYGGFFLRPCWGPCCSHVTNFDANNALETSVLIRYTIQIQYKFIIELNILISASRGLLASARLYSVSCTPFCTVDWHSNGRLCVKRWNSWASAAFSLQRTGEISLCSAQFDDKTRDSHYVRETATPGGRSSCDGRTTLYSIAVSTTGH